MASHPTTLDHRLLLPEHSPAATHPTLIMLHGRGADEEDLIGLAGTLDPALLILSVRAPHPYTFGGGYTWYDVGQIGAPEPATFHNSYERLSQFVDDALAQYPVDATRLFLLGFSMGSVMAFALALTRPHLFRGVIANSGYVPEGTDLTLQWQNLAPCSFFIAHGRADQVIPIEAARRAKQLFSASNAQLTYKEYGMGHEISQESLADAAAFLNRLLEHHPE